MNTITKRVLAGMMVLAGLTLLAPRVAAATPTKEKVLSELSSSKEATVIDGLADTEKFFKHDQDCITAAKKYFGDPRPKVAPKRPIRWETSTWTSRRMTWTRFANCSTRRTRLTSLTR